MLQSNCELNVLIKNRPIAEYRHEGQSFIEGREGSNYEIQFRNKNNFQVEVVISVDGLSITDGKEASDKSTGYIVRPYETINIPGWKVDQATAAHFAFSGKKSSYATTMTGSSNNNGVIGAMVFREKEKPKVVQPVYIPVPYNGYPFTPNPNPYRPYPPIWTSGSGLNDMPIGSSDAKGGASYSGILRNAGMNSSLSSNASPISASGCDMAETSMRNMSADASLYAKTTYAAPQTLGTEFGAATEFKTTSVEFDRGALVATFELFYDDKSGLRARGVMVERPKKIVTTPKAFPGMHCAIPPGWQG